MSYLEIYNEVVNDLLDKNNTNLDVRENRQGIFIDKLSEKEVSSIADIMEYLRRGDELRQFAETK